MSTFEEEQLKSSSEKITLATVDAAKRIIGFVVESGDVFKLTDFDFAVINSLKEDGTELTEVSNLASVIEDTWFNDRENKILYVNVGVGINPNSVFLHINFRQFFSTVPINGPNGITTGFDVHWKPLIKSTSKFGVELDNNDQIGLAIDGSGSISFFNDQEFWKPIYDKLIFENKLVFIYSLLGELPLSEAKLIYKGKVSKKSYNSATIRFTLKDLIADLEGEFPLNNISSLATKRVPNALLEAKQRRIYGRVFGHRALNIDQVLDGFPLTGTIAVALNSDILTGTGTLFLKELSPDDILIINDKEFTVEDITSDTSAKITELFSGGTASGISINILPESPKKYISREFFIAGHETRQPETTMNDTGLLNRFSVVSTLDIIEDDEIIVDELGSPEIVNVKRVEQNGVIRIREALLNPPAIGTTVKRPSVQNVRINDRRLTVLRDYNYNAVTGILTLEEDAEFNVAETRFLSGTSIEFTSGSRVVTGVGTSFKNELKSGDRIAIKGDLTFFEVLIIDSDTSLRLRTTPAFNLTGDGVFKKVNNFDEAQDVLSCDVIGTTIDDLISGELLDTASEIVKDILKRIGIDNLINAASFATAKDISQQKLGVVIPTLFGDTDSIKARELVNRVNKSIFGSLIQNKDFEIEFNILNPGRSQSVETFRTFDVVGFAVDTDIERVVKTALIRYKNQEFDFLSLSESFETKQKTSNIANFIVETKKTKTINTLLVFAKDAVILANRWSFLLELGSSILKIKAKAKAARIEINDVIELFHDKLYERVGGGTRKLSAVQSVSKDGQDVDFETEDLSNAFNRVGSITENGVPSFNNSTDDEKFENSFITDNFGLINNDPETHGLNVIW